MCLLNTKVDYDLIIVNLILPHTLFPFCLHIGRKVHIDVNIILIMVIVRK